MLPVIRIGTRESQLAVWQATKVSQLLQQHGIETQLVYIKSEGDLNLTTPLYELGVQGIFTKTLDIALLENRIDMAVHSLKDIPTMPATGLIVGAVLKRDNPLDLFVSNVPFDELSFPYTIATSSIRRRAQWLNRYPGSSVENLRGNVNTRLAKLKASTWSGAIFAAAGLERLGLTAAETGHQLQLDWMIPAPAQGAIAVACRDNDANTLELCALLNDSITQTCTTLERNFLRVLQGGCSTPISALATYSGDEIHFTGNITAPDGSERFDISLSSPFERADSLSELAARALLDQGAGKYTR
jgi:hydroxymethylbilane synthase